MRFPCVNAAATAPAQRLGAFLLVSPSSPKELSGRPAHRPFRGLLGVHTRCGLRTRTVTVIRHGYSGASDISSPPCLPRLLPAGAVAGWVSHPLESAAFPRRTLRARIAALRRVSLDHQFHTDWGAKFYAEIRSPHQNRTPSSHRRAPGYPHHTRRRNAPGRGLRNYPHHCDD